MLRISVTELTLVLLAVCVIYRGFHLKPFRLPRQPSIREFRAEYSDASDVLSRQINTEQRAEAQSPRRKVPHDTRQKSAEKRQRPLLATSLGHGIGLREHPNMEVAAQRRGGPPQEGGGSDNPEDPPQMGGRPPEQQAVSPTAGGSSGPDEEKLEHQGGATPEEARERPITLGGNARLFLVSCLCLGPLPFPR
mmetsp:Transcript_10014/g.23882  ORF Transcript_10014/g.23882 Transcript_10014/m.23882 type:complete len:193 (+) Transcript_10014:419-997(+)